MDQLNTLDPTSLGAINTFAPFPNNDVYIDSDVSNNYRFFNIEDRWTIPDFITDNSSFISNATLTLNCSLESNLSSICSNLSYHGNGSLYDGSAYQRPGTFFIVSISILLGLMILVTILGNVFVIAAILIERNLQNVANYLIVSLAVADLMVACLVMPLGALYEIMKGWILGPELCDMWTSSDVLCCTASILHLVAIAIDRYWAVTNVDYIHNRNKSRICGMIIVVWAVALIVSLAPQFGWKDPDYLDRINIQRKCMVSQDVAYQIFATCSTFYVPLLVILVVYWKIFQTARKRIHRRRPKNTPSQDSNTENPKKSSTCTCNKNKFLIKKRFRKMKSNKKSSAAEALVSSLALVEGQSTASIDIIEEDEVYMENQKSSETSGASGSGKVEENRNDSEEQEDGKLETTAFTITKSLEEAGGLGVVPVVASTETRDCVLPISAISNSVSPEKSSATTTNNGSASHQSHISDMSRVEILHREVNNTRDANSTDNRVNLAPAVTTRNQNQRQRESLEAKRERKAAKTLAIITGAFVVCWLPFFIMALLMPLCESCYISDFMVSLFLWLGYFNSTLNPVIYTIFSPEFRQAFKRMLCGHPYRRGRHRFRPGM